MENKEDKNKELVVKDKNRLYTVILCFAIITIVALLIRLLGLKFESGDMKGFLYRWFYGIKIYGGFC